MPGHALQRRVPQGARIGPSSRAPPRPAASSLVALGRVLRFRPTTVGLGLVVSEVSYLSSDRIGPPAELAFSRAIADGEVLGEPVVGPEWERIGELTQRYLGYTLGIVNASVVVLGECTTPP